MSTLKLLGMPEELRLAIEQAGGNQTPEAKVIQTQQAQAVYSAAVQKAEELANKSLKEVQEIVGPHGALSRVQAGPIRISRSEGISAAPDGVQKTTIDPRGNVWVGSDLAFPSLTTFICFVEDYVYNNETFGAGDLLIGDNTTGQSNLLYDASEGRLNFRYGQTVNVYVDTDGKLKAGAGVVTLDATGIKIVISDTLSAARSYQLVDSSGNVLAGYEGTVTPTTEVNIMSDATSIVTGGNCYNTLRAVAEAGNTAETSLTAYVNGHLSDAPVIKAKQISDGTGSIEVLKANVNLESGKTYNINGSPHTHGEAAYPTGHLYGLTLSNNAGDATNDIDIATGNCRDSTDAANMVLASALTKRLDASWAVGTNQGGLDTGSIANTTYHVWLIKRSDTGVVDALFSTSATTPTMPANYDYKRRIGSIVRTSNAIKAFYQNGDTFYWTAQVSDLTTGTATTGTAVTLTVPTGIKVEAIFLAALTAPAGGGGIRVYDPDITSASAPEFRIAFAPSSLYAGCVGRCFTNTSAQVKYWITTSGADGTIQTHGWVDARGKL